MAEERQYDNMVGKPLFDILSKLPSKPLLRFQCVSKLWREFIKEGYFVSVHDKQVIEEPTPIIFYLTRNPGLPKTFCFNTIESDTITNHVLKAKNKVPIFEFAVKKPCFSEFAGSCNGLVLIKTYNAKTNDQKPTFTVIHPINKQCYVLPKVTCICDHRVSCGLGFNTFKMVCVYPNHGAMVHVFGTNSWRKIPQVPSYPISGKAIFAHGCLHWLVSYTRENGAGQVIWFDIKNEEFGLIRPPKTISQPSKRKLNYHFYDHLVNLDDQVGYFFNKTTEVWVLNHKKEWMLHCDFEDNEFPHDSIIKVLGCLNKEQYILIQVSSLQIKKELFYTYNLENRIIYEAHIDGLDLEYKCETYMVMFPNSLCDNITNSNLFIKRA